MAQSRDAPVYSDAYSNSGYGAGGAGVSAYSNGAGYTQQTQQPAYGTQQQASASSYGANNGGANGNQGYYYYYYPVQV